MHWNMKIFWNFMNLKTYGMNVNNLFTINVVNHKLWLLSIDGGVLSILVTEPVFMTLAQYLYHFQFYYISQRNSDLIQFSLTLVFNNLCTKESEDVLSISKEKNDN